MTIRMDDYNEMEIYDQFYNNLQSSFRQGFICPFCMQDMGYLSTLHVHVEKYHPKSLASEFNILHLKGIFDKAKQKILQIDYPFQNVVDFGLFTSVESSPGFGERPKKAGETVADGILDQQMGMSCSLTEYFLKCRAPCINESAVETNTLIIRLDKLINQCPVDVRKRKPFEQKIVPWITDCDVNTCAVCIKKFTITRRRHHCRLCGKIICHSCSQYLSFVNARKLTNPAFAAHLLDELGHVESEFLNATLSSTTQSVADVIKQAVSGESMQSMRLRSEKILSSTLSLVKRDGTEVSLASLLQQDEDERLRICGKCKNLLDLRNEKMDQLSSPPMIVILYERLCSLIRRARRLTPSYARTAESLSRGESMYTLESAAQLRNRLTELQHEIDVLSTRIERCGVSNDDTNMERPSPRKLIMQKNIRNLTVQMLQDLISQMISPPSEDVYNELQEKRRAEIRSQTEAERAQNTGLINSLSSPILSVPLQLNAKATRKNFGDHSNDSVLFSSGGLELFDEGWTAAVSAVYRNPFADNERPANPLQEQVVIIRSYLKQAAEDGRLDEVKILERNLCDLENELKRLNIDSPYE